MSLLLNLDVKRVSSPPELGAIVVAPITRVATGAQVGSAMGLIVAYHDDVRRQSSTKMMLCIRNGVPEVVTAELGFFWELAAVVAKSKLHVRLTAMASVDEANQMPIGLLGIDNRGLFILSKLETRRGEAKVAVYLDDWTYAETGNLTGAGVWANAWSILNIDERGAESTVLSMRTA